MNLERNGPYLAAAILCDKILEEKDGTLSAIRIINRFLHTRMGPEAEVPEKMPSVGVNFFMLVSFKNGGFRGEKILEIKSEGPGGIPEPENLPRFSQAIEFKGQDESTSNFILRVHTQIDEEGLYWFNVFLDGELITRIPLRIQYQRIIHQGERQ